MVVRNANGQYYLPPSGSTKQPIILKKNINQPIITQGIVNQLQTQVSVNQFTPVNQPIKVVHQPISLQSVINQPMAALQTLNPPITGQDLNAAQPTVSEVGHQSITNDLSNAKIINDIIYSSQPIAEAPSDDPQPMSELVPSDQLITEIVSMDLPITEEITNS